MITQIRLNDEKKAPFYGTTYDRPQYNVVKGAVQRIELHRGCPWQHEYCYEPKEAEDFPIPELVKNQVQILDMNFLSRCDALEVIKELGKKRVNGKPVIYEFVCGIDYRFLTDEIAEAMRSNRFIRPRIAWDDPFSEQTKIKDAIVTLEAAGYRRNEISAFMIVNWRVSYSECLRKLDLMKVWNIKVCDCCYDGGYGPGVGCRGTGVAVPVYWTLEDIQDIRLKSRKHNQLVLFGIDPQIKVNQYRHCSNFTQDSPHEVGK